MNGGIPVRILNLGTRWRRMVGFKPRQLYPRGKRSQYLFDRMLNGSQIQLGHRAKQKTLYSYRLAGRSACSILTVCTVLFRVHITLRGVS
jgi:hypothetical protein